MGIYKSKYARSQIDGLLDAVPSKADDSTAVHITGAETITGDKTFSGVMVVSTPSANGHAANKEYIDSQIDMSVNNLSTAIDNASTKRMFDNLTRVELFQQLNYYALAGSLNLDYNNFVNGNMSLKCVSDNTGNDCAYRNSSSTVYSVNLNTHYLAITLNVLDITKLKYLTVEIGDTTLNNILRWRLSTSPSGAGHESNYILSDNWCTITLNLEDATTYGSPDITNLQRIQFRLRDNGQGAATVNFQSVIALKRQNAVVSFVFDDGYANTGTRAEPTLSKYGLRGTLFVVTDLINNQAVTGSMTWQRIKNLQDFSGWEIAGHGGSQDPHDSSDGYIDFSDEEIRTDFEKIKTDFVANGIKLPKGFAYPKGTWNARVEGVAREFYAYSRGINQLNGRECPITMEPYRLRALLGVSDYNGDYVTKPEELYKDGGILDKIKQYGGWLIIVFHQIVNTPSDADNAYKCSETELNKIAKAVSDKGIVALPVIEVIEKYSAR